MSVIKKINITDPTTHITTLNPIGALAGDVDYDNTTSGLQADDVQEALDEIAANMGEGTAADTTYDNTESGLSADNVQDAIDEIDLTVDSLSASVLSINNDIDEIGLDIADLSASIVSINNNINDINGDISNIELSISDLSSSVLSINGEIEDIELTIADLSASKLGYDNTQSGLSGDTIQEAIDELAGQDSGHTYKNDSGTSMTQRSNAKFNGVYVEDDSSNNTTNINIVREFQNDAEVQALTGEAAKGFQHTPDNVYRARAAADISFDPTNTLLTSTRMQEAMEELDANKLPYSSGVSTKQKIDEIDEDIIVFEFTTTLNFVQNTWTWQTLSTDASQTIPTGYKVVSAFATTNYPHADLVIPNIQEGKGHYGFMTYGTRTLSNLAVTVRAVCKKI